MAIKAKKMLEQSGFAEVWMFRDSVNVKLFIPVLKAGLVDTFLVEMRNGLNVCTLMVLSQTQEFIIKSVTFFTPAFH